MYLCIQIVTRSTVECENEISCECISNEYVFIIEYVMLLLENIGFEFTLIDAVFKLGANKSSLIRMLLK